MGWRPPCSCCEHNLCSWFLAPLGCYLALRSGYPFNPVADKSFLDMTQAFSQDEIWIRPIHYGDFEAERFCVPGSESESLNYSINPSISTHTCHAWYEPLKFLNRLLLKPQRFGAYLGDRDAKLQGVIQVSPFNRTRSTWRVDQVSILPTALTTGSQEGSTTGEANAATATARLAKNVTDTASQLLRYCFETIWEARTWLLEVNVNDKEQLALYRQNGFQPLAQMTYWEITPEQLATLAEREPDLPNLLPISNADAPLLYQLDTMSMPPLVRQVFDRHIADFKTSLLESLLQGIANWLNHTEVVSGYIFEPQRKAAIGYFQVQLCRNGSKPHQAQLTVNPAYTWLYPELLVQMARITQDLPVQSLRVASSDYQQEREEYLERLGASRVAHTLMMSRSVWHKVRESKLGAFEHLQLPEMLQGLKPARKPIPSRIDLTPTGDRAKGNTDERVKHAQVLFSKKRQPAKSDFSDPPAAGPSARV